MVKKLCVLVLLNQIVCVVIAQDASQTEITVTLTSEGQYNMTCDKSNWINLLEVGIATSLGKHFTLSSDLISIQNTRLQQGKDCICEDLQVFSNIEEENREIALFSFGTIRQVTDALRLFVGVRNVNMDYFISPMTSVFTGSSEGIYPTISENWGDLSNYPLSAMCFHLEWNFTGNWELKNSLYNGVASYKMTEVFRFRPRRDGVFNITQLGYIEPEAGKRWLGKYYIGFASGNVPDERGVKNKQNAAYALIEQPIMRGNIGLLLEGSFAPKSQPCHLYFATGLVWSKLWKEDAQLGVILNRALYKHGHETDVEMTCKIPLTKKIVLQPGMHFIRTNNATNNVGMLRVICNTSF